MPDLQLADCWGGKTPAELLAAGYSGVSCYLSPGDNQPGSKDATPAQIATYRAAGLIVVLNYESTGQTPLGGYSAGVTDASIAVSLAEARNYPDGCPIVFSVDFDPLPVEYGEIGAYFDGTRSVLGDRWTNGVYGNQAILDYVIGGQHATFGWQTTAWSGGQVSRYADLLQWEYGQEFDTSDLLVPTAPLWGITPATATTKTPGQPTPAPAPPTTTPTTTENPDMAITQLPPGAPPLALPLTGLGPDTRVTLSADNAGGPPSVGCACRVAIGSHAADVGWAGIGVDGNLDTEVANGGTWNIYPLKIKPAAQVMSIRVPSNATQTLTVGFFPSAT